MNISIVQAKTTRDFNETQAFYAELILDQIAATTDASLLDLVWHVLSAETGKGPDPAVPMAKEVRAA